MQRQAWEKHPQKLGATNMENAHSLACASAAFHPLLLAQVLGSKAFAVGRPRLSCRTQLLFQLRLHPCPDLDSLLTHENSWVEYVTSENELMASSTLSHPLILLERILIFRSGLFFTGNESNSGAGPAICQEEQVRAEPAHAQAYSHKTELFPSS